MDTSSSKAFIEDLAAFGVPVLLLSGGEPLLRDDLLELAGFAIESGLRAVLSSNGTLITEDIARRLKELGLAEVWYKLGWYRAGQ